MWAALGGKSVAFETNCGCGRVELRLILEQIAGVEGVNEGWS